MIKCASTVVWLKDCERYNLIYVIFPYAAEFKGENLTGFGSEMRCVGRARFLK